MHIRLSAFFLAIALIASTGISSATDNTRAEIVIYTEDYKPLYFPYENGRIDGTVTRLVQSLADEAGISVEMHMRPFKRGLNAVESSANHCFMALWRTEAREPNFSWVGPLEYDGYGLFALKDSTIELSSVEDSFAYATGAVGGWTSTNELQKAGHPNLVLVYEDKLNANMLQSGHTKLWLGGLISSPYVAAQEGAEIKRLLTLRKVELALACNRNIDASLINRLQAVLNTRLKK
jgi:ABC-type amino acid transport substrate-binding protein